jgi:hypothetical protein
MMKVWYYETMLDGGDLTRVLSLIFVGCLFRTGAVIIFLCS